MLDGYVDLDEILDEVDTKWSCKQDTDWEDLAYSNSLQYDEDGLPVLEGDWDYDPE